MYYVYILRSTIKDILYVGSTNDTERRIIEHNNGRTISTKPYLPWKLVFKQSFNDKATAYKTEIKLKKNKNKAILEEIIKDGYIRAISSVG